MAGELSLMEYSIHGVLISCGFKELILLCALQKAQAETTNPAPRACRQTNHYINILSMSLVTTKVAEFLIYLKTGLIKIQRLRQTYAEFHWLRGNYLFCS